MEKKINIALAQLNLMVGAIEANVQTIIKAAEYARDELKADLIIFPELSITGYPPEDLLLRIDFIQQADHGLQIVLREVKDIYCIIGHPLYKNQKLFNACSVIHNGNIVGQYVKNHLPNYGVFDECRYFTSGDTSCVVKIKNVSVGVIICEDIWFPGPTERAIAQGAELIVIPNASPFETDKHERRVANLQKRAIENRIPFVYVNMIGGQDEITFDGGSMLIDQAGTLCNFSGFFNESIQVIQVEITDKVSISNSKFTIPATIERIYESLVVATRDYIDKNNFPGVLVGLSGGIDSALTLSIAVDALGPERVQAILMPSRFTADISMEDAIKIANNLHVEYTIINIEESYSAFLSLLNPIFSNQKIDTTEQNIQARCRAIILMALSNKFGKLVLTTGNRSELAVGYCTLYGDMAGGFAVLKDVPKTLVYKLAEYRNTLSSVIPERTINRAPTAELAENQTDQDSLPPYPILDEILEYYLNQELSAAEIVAKGFDEKLVNGVVNLVRKNEYKRRQAAVGPRINTKSFGRDRRYPITNGFKG